MNLEAEKPVQGLLRNAESDLALAGSGRSWELPRARIARTRCPISLAGDRGRGPASAQVSGLLDGGPISSAAENSVGEEDKD